MGKISGFWGQSLRVPLLLPSIMGWCNKKALVRCGLLDTDGPTFKSVRNRPPSPLCKLLSFLCSVKKTQNGLKQKLIWGSSSDLPLHCSNSRRQTRRSPGEKEARWVLRQFMKHIAGTGLISNILYQNAPTEKLAFGIFRKLQKLFPPNISEYCVCLVTFPWFQPNQAPEQNTPRFTKIHFLWCGFIYITAWGSHKPIPCLVKYASISQMLAATDIEYYMLKHREHFFHSEVSIELNHWAKSDSA